MRAINSELGNFIDSNTHINWVPNIDQYPERLWESNWPWAPLISKDVNFKTIGDEIASIDHLFKEHRSNDHVGGYGHSGWSGISLHGIDYDKTENYHMYGFKTQEEANYHWTSISDKIPYITSLIKSFPFKNHGRVRIMRLAPGGYVMPHTDGTGRIFGPFNFALTNPDGCRFIFEKFGEVPFKPGRGFMLDLGIKHCVFNNSDRPRYHVIVHGEPTELIETMFKESIEEL